MVACGAIKDNLFVSSVSRYLFSTLIISFLSYLLLGTFKATVMTFPSLPVIFSALKTKNALPDSMWSITDPFLILLTINSTELDRFFTPFHYYISYTIKIWNLRWCALVECLTLSWFIRTNYVSCTVSCRRKCYIIKKQVPYKSNNILHHHLFELDIW